MPEKLEHYVKAFSNLNVNRARGKVSPHKPVMLLAVLELAETGLLKCGKGSSIKGYKSIDKSLPCKKSSIYIF